jgi:serine/threonine protein kinase/tetratricopeptide (TPR) repeat protein
MPDWNPRANDLFLKALDLPPADRPAFLAGECGADAGLRRAVDTLLAAHDKAGDFLADPFTPDGTDTFDPRTVSRGATSAPVGETGQLIAGRYKLVERIGEGGMGAVWLAEQTEPVKRKVAVKLIKAGLDSKQVLARFEAERQALALMDHPNIAKVLDGGVHDGRPFFVMELVKGVPITDFCDARKLTPQQRLELFVPVCQAIQHAHQKGVIHRDVKPANVLVALYDDRPVPKVIDFGVAKATGPTLTEHTLNTGFGGVVGTPQYMSPEQATFNNLDIDTRSDVYSLGVLLYELLAGSPPFASAELKKRGLLEILRVVREEEPPRPSTKLSTADALPSLAASRGTEPKKLTGLLRNELDWIVMKALEKDRTRRYETANGFAADVQRYLSGEPVVAVPPSSAYRFRKFVRKNRGPMVAGSLVFLALSLGIAGTTFGLVRAEQAKQREAERADGERVAKDEAVAAQEKAVAAAAAEKAARQKAVEFRDRALDALRATTGDDVEKLIGEKQDLTANEKAYLEAIAERWQAFASQEGADEHSRAIQAEGRYRVGQLWDRLGRMEKARTEYEAARDAWATLAEQFPSELKYQRHAGQSQNDIGFVLERLGRHGAAEAEYQRAVIVREGLAARFPGDPEYIRDVAQTRLNMGGLSYRRGQDVRAIGEWKSARDGMLRLLEQGPMAPDHLKQLAQIHNNLGGAFARRGQLKDARAELERARDVWKGLAGRFPRTPEYKAGLADANSNLGGVLAGLREYEKSLAAYRAAYDAQKELAGSFPAVPNYRHAMARAQLNMSDPLIALGRRDEARAELRSALADLKRLATQSPLLLEYQTSLGCGCANYGWILLGDHKPAESLEWFDLGVRTLKPIHDRQPDDSIVGHELKRNHWNRAVAHDQLQKYADAVKDWDRVVELSTPAEQVRFRASRATSRLNAGRVAEAVAEVAELRTLPGWNADQQYDFACVYAAASGKIENKKREYADAAVELLAKAIKAGYKDIAHMKADTDLDPLRGREDFKKLLADLEAKFPPKREVLPPPRRER